MFCGDSVSAICETADMHYVSYMRLEQARSDNPTRDNEPLSRKPGKGWRQNALRLADHYFCDPEDLFPEEAVRAERERLYIEAVGSAALISDYSKQAAIPVDERYEQAEIRNAVRSAMKRCTPKQRVILKVMSEFARPTFEDAGKLCGISSQAAQYAYDAGIYKMCSLPELRVFEAYAPVEYPRRLKHILALKRAYRLMVSQAWLKQRAHARIWRVP